jgi:ELWxxDGT repeat protein
MFFLARGLNVNRWDLWRTDGTKEGTELIVETRSTRPSIVAFGNQFAVTADVFPSEFGREIQLIDFEGRSTFYDIAEGPAGSSPEPLAVVSDTLLFAADDGVHGRELWRARNGQVELLDDIAAERRSSNPSSAMRAGGRIFFAADHPSIGTELWAIAAADVTGVPACVGDCDYDGAVTVDELLVGMSEALVGAEQIVCDAFDRDRSETTTVDEIVAGVNNALAGCAS